MTKVPDAATSVADESVPLQTVPGMGRMSGDQSDIPTGHVRDYRRLAIGSIICGMSCIGIFALINSVKVRERRTSDPEKAQIYSHKAWKFSLIAIAVWVGVIILIPVLMALVSFLLTLKN
ncbi:transmembrane protein 265-like [Megalops cyprinoides]|uniref:transmembrane protein 265-like n=1 Tax=Megalops cyprinoides TaxID=118141 RepID=UPI001864167C|nr:transmembrane protein 265-like [Megalops cyprinoides]